VEKGLAMSTWDRSKFAMSGSEHEIHEAVVAMLRVLENAGISDSARQALERAVGALRGELS
jgi:hypothetical protein